MKASSGETKSVPVQGNAMPQNNKLSIIALIIFSMLAISLYAKPHIQASITNLLLTRLKESGIKTQGIIVEKELNEKFRRNSSDNVVHINLANVNKNYGIIHYEFRGSDGKVRAGLDDVDQETFERYEQKERTPIVYFRNFPFLNKIESNLKVKKIGVAPFF